MHYEAHFDSLYGIIDAVVHGLYGSCIGDIELLIGTCHHHGLHIGVEVVGERNQPPQAVSTIMMSPTERPPNGKAWSVWSVWSRGQQHYNKGKGNGKKNFIIYI